MDVRRASLSSIICSFITPEFAMNPQCQHACHVAGLAFFCGACVATVAAAGRQTPPQINKWELIGAVCLRGYLFCGALVATVAVAGRQTQAKVNKCELTVALRLRACLFCGALIATVAAAGRQTPADINKCELIGAVRLCACLFLRRAYARSFVCTHTHVWVNL